MVLAAATERTAIRSSPSDHFHLLSTTSTSHKTSSTFINIFQHYSVSKAKVYSPLRASKVQRPEEGSSINTNDNRNGPFDAQDDDLNYLLKLGAGSFAGAVTIKYGSILFPDITRPNITEALVIILAPVVVAVVLLWKQSRHEQ